MLATALQTQAQTKIGGTGAPDNSAMLEVTGGTGNNKGILPPRLTTAQRDAITNPASGLMIYNTTASQLQVNTGTPAAPAWTAAASGSGWTTSGNAGTTAGTSFVGTTDAQNLAFKVNNQDKMRLTSIGLVVGDTAMVSVDPSGTNLNGGINLVNNGGTTWNDDITIQSFSTVPGAGLLLYAAHGTKAAPQSMQGGQDIGVLAFRGRRPVDWGATADIVATAVGNSANLGTQLQLKTSNSSGSNVGIIIDSSARVGIGASAPGTDLHIIGNGILVAGSGTTDPVRKSQLAVMEQLADPYIMLDGGNIPNSRQMGIYFRDASDSTRDVIKFDYSTAGVRINKVSRAMNAFTQQMFWLNDNDTAAMRLWIDHQIMAAGVLISSDEKVKTNIRNVDQGLSTIMSLQPKLYDKYNYTIAQKGLVIDREHTNPEFGFLAQEVDKVLPGIVRKPNKETDLYAVNYIQLIPILTKAVQEQQAQIEILKAENEKLKDNRKAAVELEERVKKMERMLDLK